MLAQLESDLSFQSETHYTMIVPPHEYILTRKLFCIEYSYHLLEKYMEVVDHSLDEAFRRATEPMP